VETGAINTTGPFGPRNPAQPSEHEVDRAGLFGSVNSLGSLNADPKFVTSSLIGTRRLSKPNTAIQTI
jgi:hypothetical protein